RVFKGRVRYVLDAIAAGQLQPTGGLVDVGARTAGGRALAVIDITGDMSSYQIPLGAAAQGAIYTEHWHHVSLLRKILLRMRSWQNYVFLEGHSSAQALRKPMSSPAAEQIVECHAPIESADLFADAFGSEQVASAPTRAEDTQCYAAARKVEVQLVQHAPAREIDMG